MFFMFNPQSYKIKKIISLLFFCLSFFLFFTVSISDATANPASCISVGDGSALPPYCTVNDFMSSLDRGFDAAFATGSDIYNLANFFWKIFAYIFFIFLVIQYVLGFKKMGDILAGFVLMIILQGMIFYFIPATNMIYDASKAMTAAIQKSLYLAIVPNLTTINEDVFDWLFPMKLLWSYFLYIANADLAGDLGRTTAIIIGFVIVAALFLVIAVISVFMALWTSFGIILAKALGFYFIPFLFFKKTAPYFDNWFKFFIGYVLFGMISQVTLSLIIVMIALHLKKAWGAPFNINDVLNTGVPPAVDTGLRMVDAVGLLTFAALIGISAFGIVLLFAVPSIVSQFDTTMGSDSLGGLINKAGGAIQAGATAAVTGAWIAQKAGGMAARTVERVAKSPVGQAVRQGAGNMANKHMPNFVAFGRNTANAGRMAVDKAQQIAQSANKQANQFAQNTLKNSPLADAGKAIGNQAKAARQFVENKVQPVGQFIANTNQKIKNQASKVAQATKEFIDNSPVTEFVKDTNFFESKDQRYQRKAGEAYDQTYKGMENKPDREAWVNEKAQKLKEKADRKQSKELTKLDREYNKYTKQVQDRLRQEKRRNPLRHALGQGSAGPMSKQEYAELYYQKDYEDHKNSTGYEGSIKDYVKLVENTEKYKLFKQEGNAMPMGYGENAQEYGRLQDDLRGYGQARDRAAQEGNATSFATAGNEATSAHFQAFAQERQDRAADQAAYISAVQTAQAAGVSAPDKQEFLKAQRNERGYQREHVEQGQAMPMGYGENAQEYGRLQDDLRGYGQARDRAAQEGSATSFATAGNEATNPHFQAFAQERQDRAADQAAYETAAQTAQEAGNPAPDKQEFFKAQRNERGYQREYVEQGQAMPTSYGENAQEYGRLQDDLRAYDRAREQAVKEGNATSFAAAGNEATSDHFQAFAQDRQDRAADQAAYISAVQTAQAASAPIPDKQEFLKARRTERAYEQYTAAGNAMPAGYGRNAQEYGRLQDDLHSFNRAKQQAEAKGQDFEDTPENFERFGEERKNKKEDRAEFEEALRQYKANPNNVSKPDYQKFMRHRQNEREFNQITLSGQSLPNGYANDVSGYIEWKKDKSDYEKMQKSYSNKGRNYNKSFQEFSIEKIELREYEDKEKMYKQKNPTENYVSLNQYSEMKKDFEDFQSNNEILDGAYTQDADGYIESRIDKRQFAVAKLSGDFKGNLQDFITQKRSRTS